MQFRPGMPKQTAVTRALAIVAVSLLAVLPLGAQTNLALERPVSASSFEGDSFPEYAVDGATALTQWWGANPFPQWLAVDLEWVARVETLGLFTYWDGNRTYQYTIEVSLDGVQWTLAVDQSGNTVPSTAAGFTHAVPGVLARFVRVNMLHNTANPGVHIVELEVLGSRLPPGEIEVVPGGTLDFGTMEIHAGPTAGMGVEIRNTDATHSLVLAGVEVTGEHAAEFVVVEDSGETTLSPGTTRTLELAFDPALPGARRAQLIIDSNDGDEGHLSIELVGQGGGTLLPLVPQPLGITIGGGRLSLGASSQIRLQETGLATHARVLASELYRCTGLRLGAGSGPPRPGDIALELDASLGEEEYRLHVADSVTIRGRDLEALAHGTATLVQLVGGDGSLPKVSVRDAPAHPYRALSLDVARKFHSLDVLEQAVDLCRHYKVRYLGLHLTDDQNFMFPSTAFPNLDQNNFDQPAYTLAQLRELEAYAVERGVRIVPELDVPGHSAKMVQLYPDVFGSLSGGTIDFQLPSCVAGVKTIIGEMLEVFPSATHFHIGGDESGFSHLPAFVPFVEALNDLVRAGGRTTVMWEGFGPESDVPRDILILNWESSYFPPQAMLAAGYTVVNAGWDPLYVVDHYPWVQYTYLDQERLYGLDPFTFGHVAPGYPASNGIQVPPGSAVAGAELCWWEGRGPYALPILRSRVAPMAARVWNPVGEASFISFEERYQATDARLEALLFPVSVRAHGVLTDHWKPEQHFVGVTDLHMETALSGTIHYTLDGSTPDQSSPVFAGLVSLGQTATVQAALFENGRRVGFPTRIGLRQVQLATNLTTGKPVRTDAPAFLEHPVDLVVDGVIDRDAYWSTFPNPASLVVDLDAPHSLDGVTVYSRWGNGYYERYRVEVSSDGKTWSEVVDATANSTPATSAGYAHSFPATAARYLRLTTTGNSWFPAGRFPRIVEIQVHEAP